MGPELFDEKTDDPARRPENRQEIELHRNPGRVLALIENQGLTLNLDADGILLGVQVDGEGYLDVVSERVLRAGRSHQ